MHVCITPAANKTIILVAGFLAPLPSQDVNEMAENICLAIRER